MPKLAFLLLLNTCNILFNCSEFVKEYRIIGFQMGMRIDWQLRWVNQIDWYSLRNTRLLAFEWKCQIDWQS